MNLMITLALALRQSAFKCYIIAVTWAPVICQICTPKARALWAYVSGKSLVHILQLYNTMQAHMYLFTNTIN